MSSLEIAEITAARDVDGQQPVVTAQHRSAGVTIGAFVVALAITALVSHFIATWTQLRTPTPILRRIGPASGPQVLCAGSSVLQWAFSWRAVSDRLGQGIEGWGLGGSTPLEWDVFDTWTENSNMLIAGISIYDLNEEHSCNWSADIVPLRQAVQNLRETHMSWEFSKRALSQYPLAWTRKLFPTAANSDAVLVGLRSKLMPQGSAGDVGFVDQPKSANEPANAPALEEATLAMGGSSERMSDWPEDKRIRRLAHFTQVHSFNGPIRLAFRRMLHRAEKRGPVIVAVLPVSPSYQRRLTTEESRRDFAGAVRKLENEFPHARFVRLESLDALQSDGNFEDPVHLNGRGQRIATEAFLGALSDLGR